MSYKCLIFILPLLMVSCKKEAALAKSAQTDSLKVIPISSAKSIAFDSLLLSGKSKRIQEFYRNNLFKTVWTEDKDRETFLEFVKESAAEGMDPEDYNYKVLAETESSRKKLNEKQLITVDILLTESFQRFANHLYNGKLDPTQLYTDWDMYPKNIKAIDLLQEGIRNHSLEKALDTLKPTHVAYLQLKKSLEKINRMPNDHFTPISVEEKIKPNDSTATIKAVKERLAYWGDYRKPDTLTAFYDSKTVSAVKKFQQRHGLLPDGIIGKGTLTALNFSKTQRKQQILANLERWRWYPRHLGNDYVIVNIPEFRLTAVKGKDSMLVHKVVVGRDKRKTPILTSKFSNLVINPTWTVPPTIIKEDLGPTAAKNRGYFTETGITIYNSAGQEVSPWNWNASKPNNYRYVQKPGYNNSLGLVKFNFPNSRLVYLHDTNHRDYFGLSARALSSGCIRVENPFELAYYILETDENVMNKERVEKLIESEKTSGIPIKKPIHIHVLYWTAWMNENGFQFRNDIYNLDFELYQKLRN